MPGGERAPGSPSTGRFRVCPNTNPTNWPIRVRPKRPGIRVRVPPSGLWPPRPRRRLACQGAARGHAPAAPHPPPPATGQRPRPPGHRPSGLPNRHHRPTGAPAKGLPPRGPRAPARAEGEPQDAAAAGPSAWPRGVTPACPTARPPATLRLTRRRSRPSSRAPLARWLLASLYTLRPHLGGKTVGNP